MKKAEFWTQISLFLLLMLADGALTYINTPDLSLEGNPLAAQFGLGWGALAIANIIAFAGTFAAGYYSYFVYKTVFTKETTYTRYWSQITFDRPDMFWKGAVLPPKHWKPYIAALGFCMLPAAVVSRLIVVLEWLCPWSNAYLTFRSIWCFGRVDVCAAALVAMGGMFFWFYREFRTQRKQQDA